MSRRDYLKRVFASYIFHNNSQKTFWYEEPEVNNRAFGDNLDQYYMLFEGKANYPGPFDNEGIPLLNYYGKIGKQYMPIAIAQYALANYNVYKQSEDVGRYKIFKNSSSWLINNLRETEHGTLMWPHNFNFEYFRPLIAPWYSGLAQGQGLSVLLRYYNESGEKEYLVAAERVFNTMCLPIDEGGVQFKDEKGSVWIEEYFVNPTTHILNGFIWALWGVYDYFLLTGNKSVEELFFNYIDTIIKYLSFYDNGYWSLYELTPQKIKNISSIYYHKLHITQLIILNKMTNIDIFDEYAEKWRKYYNNTFNKSLATAYKIFFKLAYY